MASSNFIGTLAEAISIIPEGPWWLVHERDAGDMGISKAIGMPRKEIEALLINAGILRETTKGIQFKVAGWDAFVDGHNLPDSVQAGKSGKQIYIGRCVRVDSPAKQQSQRVAFPKAFGVSAELRAKIEQSTEEYNRRKQAEKNAVAEKKRQKEEARAAAAAEKKRREEEANAVADANATGTEAAASFRKRPLSSSDEAASTGNDERRMKAKTDDTSNTRPTSTSVQANYQSMSGNNRSGETTTAAAPRPMDVDVDAVATMPATVSPSNIQCRGIESTDANRDAYREFIAKGIHSMAQCSSTGSLPEPFKALSIIAKRTARGFIGSGQGNRTVIVHDPDNNFNYVLRSPLCPINIENSDDGVCLNCRNARHSTSNMISQMKKAKAKHQEPAKPTTRLDAICNSPTFARSTIKGHRNDIKELKIQNRTLQIENLELKKDGESIFTGKNPRSRKGIERVINTLILADKEGGVREQLNDDEAASIEWSAHIAAAIAHKKKYKGSLRGYKYSAPVLRFAMSICEQMGGEVYDKACEMWMMPKRRWLQQRKSVVSKGLGDGNGILYNALELTMAQIDSQIRDDLDDNDAKVDWVTAYDAMKLKEGFFYVGDEIVGMDEVEDFDVVRDTFKSYAKKQNEEAAEGDSEPTVDKLIGDDKHKAQHHLVVYATPTDPALKKHRFIIGVFNMATLTTNRLDHILECIGSTIGLQKSTRDIINVYDGAGENQGYRNRHVDTTAAEILGPERVAELKKAVPNVDFNFMIAKTLPSGTRIWFMEDWCHVVKRLRNALDASTKGAKKAIAGVEAGKDPPRNMRYDVDGIPYPMNLEMLETAVEVTDGFTNDLQIAHQFHRKMFHPEGNNKLNVANATKVLSGTMVNVIDRAQEENPEFIGPVPSNQYEKLKEFCVHADIFVDVMSGDMDGGVVTPDNAEEFITNLLTVLQWFSEWKENAKGDESRFLSDDTWDGLQTICMGVICLIYEKVVDGGESLSIKALETDCVENHFNHCRQKSGGSQAVTAVSASRSAIASFVVRTFGSKKGNNGGAGEESALGVNEACRLLKDKDSSKAIGSASIMGSATLSAINDATSGDVSEPTVSWGAPTRQGDDSSLQNRRGPIKFEGKAAIWRALAHLTVSHSTSTSDVSNILQSEGIQAVKTKYHLKDQQIERQINNYIAEQNTLHTSRVNAATAAAAAVADADSNPPNNDNAVSTTPPTPALRKQRSTPFGARVELDELFTKWNLPDRQSFPATDPEINAIVSKYDITVPDAKTELGHWRARGGQYSGKRLEGVDKATAQKDLRKKLQIGPDALAEATLTDLVSGKSGAVSSYKVPIHKLRDWRPDIAIRVEVLIDKSSSVRADVLQFWAGVAGGFYLAAIDNFAYCAEERDKKARKYQSDLVKLREEKAKEWCELMDSTTGGLAREDAHPFYTFAFYFLLQQFTYMAKYGGEDDDYRISVDIDNFDVITKNAKVVLYYLAGWVAHGIEKKQVAKDLVPVYQAFKLNNSLTKEAADDFGLPTFIVELRRKRPGSKLVYAGPVLHKFLMNIEAVYRRHGNEQGFDRYGGKLFQFIERAVLDNEEMYQKFLNCLGSVVCSDEVKRKMYSQAVCMYTTMRGKYMVKTEQARESKSGNQIFTTVQTIEIAKRVAQEKGKLTKKLKADMDLPSFSDGIWDTIDNDMQVLINQ